MSCPWKHQKTALRALFWAFVVFGGAWTLAAPLKADYVASIPEYEANPGHSLRVPVRISDAAGLARIRVQINYDEQVAVLDQVTTGGLGSQFDLDWTEEDGVLTIDCLRAEELASGGGEIVWLDFTLNEGAPPGVRFEIALALFEIGDASGVTDLSAATAVDVDHGAVTLSLDPNIDNSGNRLPDWWEQAHGLDPYAVLADDDEEGDGISNLMEYASGGHPVLHDAATIRPWSEIDGSGYLNFTFRRRGGDNALGYTVWESSDLAAWNSVDLASRMTGPPVSVGDDIEEVTIRSADPTSDPEAPEQLFFRLEVER